MLEQFYLAHRWDPVGVLFMFSYLFAFRLSVK